MVGLGQQAAMIRKRPATPNSLAASIMFLIQITYHWTTQP
ncbi:hypothetical protein JCM19237_246 [Photobacterium aphoticum]|uniref:Uncharacterized protein n=1 Tax=Photobacterium aphoticum TaxID=754436 RepID=A0A090QYC1_9GAMM|nr:hypothetical protein JCM19237_246 [Photobacterium aphoticum]